MHLIWGPAADNQFGNAVLSRLPVRSSGSGRLPQAGGAQVPGYVWARVEVGGGRTVDVWSTRLDDAAGPDLIQAAKLLTAWGGGPRTVIAASMRAPGAGGALDRVLDGSGLRNASAASLATGPDSAGAGPGADADADADADSGDGDGDGERDGEWILGTDDVLFADSNVAWPSAPGGRPVATAVNLAG
jgi:hypothetical protein